MSTPGSVLKIKLRRVMCEASLFDLCTISDREIEFVSGSKPTHENLSRKNLVIEKYL